MNRRKLNQVLIISDSMFFCEILKYAFKEMGIEQGVVSCNEKDALHIVRESSPAMIVIDQPYPKLDHVDYLSQQRGQKVNVLIIGSKNSKMVLCRRSATRPATWQNLSRSIKKTIKIKTV